MAVTHTHDDYKSDITFLAENSKFDGDNTVRTVTKANYMKLMDQHGLPEQVITSYHDAHEKMTAAAAHIATTDLEAKIKETRAAGEDPSGLRSTLRIATPGGGTEVQVLATRTRPNPRTHEPVVKHGVVVVSIDAAKRIADSATDFARETITRSLGL